MEDKNIVPLNNEFDEIVLIIQRAREKAVYQANATMVDLYWNIGKILHYKICNSEWGDGVVKQLSMYISRNYSELRGFSDKNLWRMKQFYEVYSGMESKLSPLVRQISWTNNLIILSRTKSIDEKEFYLNLCAKERYSKRELERQIDSALYERKVLNSPKLSPMVKDMNASTDDIFKDRYVMEFLGKKEFSTENAFRMALVSHMKDFILELGKDFIFIGQEYRIQVGYSDFRIDLLFYHRELQCLVAFELKNEKFKPEHLGQLNFYLEALDRDVKKSKENPSIGVLLCKDKDDEVVEYALSRSLSPTMVAEYQLCLPNKKILQQKLREIFEENEC